MIKVNEKQFVQILPTIMNNGGAVYVRPATTLVHLGLNTNIDENYCVQNNIPVFRVQRLGGAIVSHPNDYDFVVIEPKTYDGSRPALFQKLIHTFLKNNLTAVFENNDLLVDGYKVASYSYRELDNGMLYLAMHISMSVDLELIKSICKKEMIKIPKGLNDFGIYEDTIDKLITETY